MLGKTVVLKFVLGVAASLALACPAMAATPPPVLDTSAYARLPAVELVQLAPSGEMLASISVVGDQRSLLVKDLAGKVLLAVPVGELKVRGVDWAGDDHLLVTISGTANIGGGAYDHEFFHVLVVNLLTKNVFEALSKKPAIFPAVFGYYGAAAEAGRWYGYFGGLTLSKTRGFDATLYQENYPELYRVDLDSGASNRVASGRDASHEWVVNDQGVVVAHTEYKDKNGDWVLFAGGTQSSPVASSREPLGEISLAGLGASPDTVVVDKSTPEEWSLADGTHHALSADGPFRGLIFDPVHRRLVGVTLRNDRQTQQFFDPMLKARLAALRKGLGDSTALVSWSSDLRRLIAFTEGDGDAGTYWLIDGKAAKALAYPYPELPDVNVATTRMIAYRAADGLEIHGILTLPPGREAKALPLVVLPHGGPEGHDSLSFDWWAQAFAGRGYAVFQPNFRGSNDQGLSFRDAGFGQWGRKMQTDISDGVAELARQGVVDPKRACIVGGSYGGYAALAGVTVQQGLYRCAVAVAGVSDLNYMLSWQTDQRGGARTASMRYWRKFMGAGSDGDPTLKAISPAQLADRADAPILLVHGADDTVVPIDQSREMERALKRAGKPVDFLLLPGEDHWLSREATRKAMLSATVAFVEKHNPAD